MIMNTLKKLCVLTAWFSAFSLLSTAYVHALPGLSEVQATRKEKKEKTKWVRQVDSTKNRWVFDFAGGINFAQNYLQNWAAGGESSLAGAGKLDMNLLYTYGGHMWESKLKTAYGLSYTKTNGLNKTADNLLISTAYGYAMPGDHFFYKAYADIQTQYDLGYANADGRKNHDEYISAIFSPGYLNASLGIEYRLKTLLSVYFSPASTRTTFVTDDFLSNQGLFGVDSGKHVMFEAGMSLQINFAWTFWKNFTLKTDAKFFTPYNRDFGNIVVDWNVGLEMAINSYFSASIGTSLKYDDKVKSVRKDGSLGGPKVQFREFLTIGIGYTFQQKSKKLAF